MNCAFCNSEYHDSKLHPGTCTNCGAPKALQEYMRENPTSVHNRSLEEMIVTFDMENIRIDKSNEAFINQPLETIHPSLRELVKRIREYKA